MNLLANVTLLKKHKLYRNSLSEVVVGMNRSAWAQICGRSRGPGEGGGTFAQVEYVDRADLTPRGLYVNLGLFTTTVILLECLWT